MKTQYFLKLLGYPHKITAEDVSSLQDLVQKYPYFQVAYALLAKGSHDQDHVTVKQAIQLAAIHATDRNHLKALLDDAPPFSIPISAPQKAQAPEEKRESVDDYDFINGYINAIRQKEERPITKQKSLAQLHVIQDFMQKDVHFKPQPLPEVPDEDFQRDLTQESTVFHDDLVTENLAQVLVKQGKFARASDIYAQLLLKFPEKKAYFAGLITELKSQL